MEGAISFTKRKAGKESVLIINDFMFKLLRKYAVLQNSLNFFERDFLFF